MGISARLRWPLFLAALIVTISCALVGVGFQSALVIRSDHPTNHPMAWQPDPRSLQLGLQVFVMSSLLLALAMLCTLAACVTRGKKIAPEDIWYKSNMHPVIPLASAASSSSACEFNGAELLLLVRVKAEGTADLEMQRVVLTSEDRSSLLRGAASLLEGEHALTLQMSSSRAELAVGSAAAISQMLAPEKLMSGSPGVQSVVSECQVAESTNSAAINSEADRPAKQERLISHGSWIESPIYAEKVQDRRDLLASHLLALPFQDRPALLSYSESCHGTEDQKFHGHTQDAQVQAAPQVADAVTETSIVWGKRGFRCTKCSKPPLLPTKKSNTCSSEDPGLDGEWLLQDPTGAAQWLMSLNISGMLVIDGQGMGHVLTCKGSDYFLSRGLLKLNVDGTMTRIGKTGTSFTFSRRSELDLAPQLRAPTDGSTCSLQS